ncbi:site-specific integrase [uncultured Clostridium sp.]|uniref:site-specific integrase n=1 Tax=uncultured Clostridium sp. TaxID=59620 RepID=UPI00263735BB|nr:site-specific integrase [uncultured Clostridium sp.]
MSNPTVISLVDLIKEATQHLNELNYSEGTKLHYTLKWKHLLQYANHNNVDTFSLKLGYKFLESHYGIRADMKLKASEVHSVRTVKVLYEFINHNKFYKCHQPKGKESPSQFNSVLEEYIQLQHDIQLSERTIQGKRIILINFLSFISKQQVKCINELTSKHVLLYIHTLSSYSQATKSGILFTLRDFLTFLYSSGYTIERINKLFPVIFSNKFERIPSYYSSDEMHKILNCINRDTVIGRRDYIIILLAVQLGLRAGDIRNLRFNSIKWNIDAIEFIQEKTKNSLQLPLLENLKYALLDYIKNSRPNSDSNFIFVRHRAPFIPFTTGNVFFETLNKYMKAAAISIDNRKHGLHSMRHSMASNLLRHNTPLPIITGILGHVNTNTTRLYLRIDIEQLRSVALEVPDER